MNNKLTYLLLMLCGCQPLETIADNQRNYVSFACQESAVDTEIDCKNLLWFKNKIRPSRKITEKDCTDFARSQAKACHLIEDK